jgi:ERAP1-like C-terminal domain
VLLTRVEQCERLPECECESLRSLWLVNEGSSSFVRVRYTPEWLHSREVPSLSALARLTLQSDLWALSQFEDVDTVLAMRMSERVSSCEMEVEVWDDLAKQLANLLSAWSADTEHFAALERWACSLCSPLLHCTMRSAVTRSKNQRLYARVASLAGERQGDALLVCVCVCVCVCACVCAAWMTSVFLDMTLWSAHIAHTSSGQCLSVISRSLNDYWSISSVMTLLTPSWRWPHVLQL